jgi:hypothetical protein
MNLRRRQGKARLSALFGDKDTLFVIHNMTDGFNGVFEHLRDRAACGVVAGHARTAEEFCRRSWLEVSHGL